MSNSERQWMWTKLVASLLALFLLISTCVGAANIILDIKGDAKIMRVDIARNEGTLVKHEVSDEKKWDKIFADVDSAEASINELKIQGARQATQYSEIMRRLDDLNRKIDNLEFAGDKQ